MGGPTWLRKLLDGATVVVANVTTLSALFASLDVPDPGVRAVVRIVIDAPYALFPAFWGAEASAVRAAAAARATDGAPPDGVGARAQAICAIAFRMGTFERLLALASEGERRVVAFALIEGNGARSPKVKQQPAPPKLDKALRHLVKQHKMGRANSTSQR